MTLIRLCSSESHLTTVTIGCITTKKVLKLVANSSGTQKFLGSRRTLFYSVKVFSRRRLSLAGAIRVKLLLVAGVPPPCTGFDDWVYTPNYYLSGYPTNDDGQSTEDFPNWSDTYDNLVDAQIACIEGLRVKIFKIKKNCGDTVFRLYRLNKIPKHIILNSDEAANCGGVTEVPANGFHGVTVYKIRFYHGLIPNMVQGTFYEPGSNSYQKPDCPCFGMNDFLRKKKMKKNDAVFRSVRTSVQNLPP